MVQQRYEDEQSYNTRQQIMLGRVNFYQNQSGYDQLALNYCQNFYNTLQTINRTEYYKISQEVQMLQEVCEKTEHQRFTPLKGDQINGYTDLVDKLRRVLGINY